MHANQWFELLTTIKGRQKEEDLLGPTRTTNQR